MLGQAAHAVLGVDVAELAGLAGVPLREGERHEVLVAAVHGQVLAVLAQQNQPDVDRLEDRVGEGAGVAELLEGGREVARPARAADDQPRP